MVTVVAVKHSIPYLDCGLFSSEIDLVATVLPEGSSIAQSQWLRETFILTEVAPFSPLTNSTHQSIIVTACENSMRI